jgi:hypothetical protein
VLLVPHAIFMLVLLKSLIMDLVSFPTHVNFAHFFFCISVFRRALLDVDIIL